MKARILLISLLVVIAAQSWAAGPVYGPIVDGYGPVFMVEDRDVTLPSKQIYKVVFDASAYPGGDDALNIELESVARFINMHGGNGVRLDDMDIAVVLHGPALKSVLSDNAYRTRFDTKNPNAELVQLLSKAGVRFYVCGQSMGFRDFGKEELAENVGVALSAMTMLATLQSQGHSLLP